MYERFFEEVGKPMDGEAGPPVFEDQPDVGRLVEVAAEHGIEMPVPIAQRSRAQRNQRRVIHELLTPL